MTNRFIKDPDATLDYAVDWSDWLGNDTIDSVSWTVPAGISQVSVTNTTTKATIWVSGGTIGRVYTIVCRITTAAGRTDDRNVLLRIGNK